MLPSPWSLLGRPLLPVVALTCSLGCKEQPLSSPEECAAVQAAGESGLPHLVVLDFDGLHLVPGPVEDAATGVTPLAQEPLDVPPFDGTKFATVGGGLGPVEVTTAVRALLAPLNVSVVNSPPTSGSFVRVVVGGLGESLGFAPAQYGVAVEGCQVDRPNGAVVAVFSETIAPSAALLISVIGHEVGHVVGLMHGANEFDIMFPYPDGRQFAWMPDDVLGQDCGSPRQDPIRASSQFSGVSLASVIWPPKGATIGSRFSVAAAVSRREGVVLRLHVNGCLAATSSAMPFGFMVACDSNCGAMQLEVEEEHAGAGRMLVDKRSVTVSDSVPAEPWLSDVNEPPPGPCPGVRVSALSSLGAPRTWHVVGEDCTDPLDCASGVCLRPPNAPGVCAEPCSLDRAGACTAPDTCFDVGGTVACGQSCQRATSPRGP
jgi:hypothetical protein